MDHKQVTTQPMCVWQLITGLTLQREAGHLISLGDKIGEREIGS